MSSVIAQNEVKSRQVDLHLTGMTCSSCVSTIEGALNKVPGVKAVVNLAMESAHVIAPINISEQDLITAVSKSGYKASAFKGERESFEKSNRLGVRVFLTLLLTAPVILISMFHSWHEQIDKQLSSSLDQVNNLLNNLGISLIIG